MKKYFTVFSLLLFSASLVFLLNSPSESLAAVKTNPKAVQGKQLYDAKCLGCHGVAGIGGTAPRINKKSINALMKAIKSGGGDAESGESGEGGEGSMPTFNLTRKEVSNIKYYMAHPKQAGTGTTTTTTSSTTTSTGTGSSTTTTSASTTTTTPSTPTYNGAVKAILDSNCKGCHSGYGTYSGASGAFASRNLIKTRVDNGSMPPSGSLSAANIATIDAWVAGGAPQ